jgi:hypothetical protein
MVGVRLIPGLEFLLPGSDIRAAAIVESGFKDFEGNPLRAHIFRILPFRVGYLRLMLHQIGFSWDCLFHSNSRVGICQTPAI